MKSRIEEIIGEHNEMYDAFKKLNEKIEGKTEPKFKIGNYLTMINSEGSRWIGILRGNTYRGDGGFPYYAAIDIGGDFRIDSAFGFQNGDYMRMSIPEEIAILDSKLAEQGKKFDKYRCEIVEIKKTTKKCEDCVYEIANTCHCYLPNCHFISKTQSIPQPKPPIIGEMAIFSDEEKKHSCCRLFKEAFTDGYFVDNYGVTWKYAVLFESPEQYKQFLKS